MGTWGTAIKDNDTSSDIYADFYDLYNEGQQPYEKLHGEIKSFPLTKLTKMKKWWKF